jgi:hypothetical protein
MTAVAVTLIRAAAPGGGPVSFVAVRSAEALGVLASLGSIAEDAPGYPVEADTRPWEALPGVRSLAARELDGRPPKTILLIGTAVEGRWTTWNPPCPRPAVPA